MNSFIKKLLPFFFTLLISLVLFTLTARGNLGNPTVEDIEQKLYQDGRVFETSQERSRYAMILSLYYDHTIAIDNFASMGTPDIGFIKGHYFSFFPPGASIIAYPFFIIGTQLHIAQLAVFSVPTIFTLLTILLIVKFCKKLNLHWSVSILAALSYGFATNAWGYSVTFYAHTISAFFILIGLYTTLFKKNIIGSLLFWLSYAIAVFIDFPNLFIFMPMAIVQSLQFLKNQQEKTRFRISFDFRYIITPFLFIFLMLGYGYYNYYYFGSATKLSNTIPRVRDLYEIEKANPKQGREAISVLKTRKMLEGFNSFLISEDRGLLYFTPIAFLAIFGLGKLPKKNKDIEVLLLAVPITCLILYTMFGDPYGGWAFGSRYMLAIMPPLMILGAIGLNHWTTHPVIRKKNNVWINRLIVIVNYCWARLLFSIIFAYSMGVSLLAPLTTNVIAPKVEAEPLNLPYTYVKNISMLSKDRLNSFYYNQVLQKSIPGWAYYWSIFGPLLSIAIILIWIPKKEIQL